MRRQRVCLGKRVELNQVESSQVESNERRNERTSRKSIIKFFLPESVDDPRSSLDSVSISNISNPSIHPSLYICYTTILLLLWKIKTIFLFHFMRHLIQYLTSSYLFSIFGHSFLSFYCCCCYHFFPSRYLFIQ